MKFLLMKGTIDLRKKNNSFERLQKETVKIDVGDHKFKSTKAALTKIPSKLSKFDNIEICKRAYIFIGL